MQHSRHPRQASHTSRLGGWLPSDPAALSHWLHTTAAQAEALDAPLHPVVEEFRQLIESDPVLYMNFTLMFEQQPRFAPSVHSGDLKLKNYRQMLAVLSHVMGTAPAYDETGMVGFPINAILDFPMITPAGLAAFTSPKVNAMIRKVLAAWAAYLDSPESRYVLNDSASGWLGAAARETLHLDEIEMDAADPHGGFRSWNDFFIRRFKPGRRPVAEPGNDKLIACACESTPFAISTNVRAQDSFWNKSQPYSLRQMLDGHHVERFVGGTVYQAFLSAENYHRWHSPVTGTIRLIRHVPGTYYAEAASEGFDELGPNNSQGYLAHVATRALIFIEADDPVVGLMCFIAIGMAEVSSCLVGVKQGQRVSKGQELGYFQYGGSTHCLTFGPGVIKEFALAAIPQGEKGSQSTIVQVNSALATVN